MTENKRKAFDPTNSFTFFGSWVRAIEAAEKISVETAYRFFKAIAHYSMYDETSDFEDNPVLSMTWNLIEKEIDNSVDRRKRNFDKDTFNEDYQKIIDAVAKHPNCSLREIADFTGTSKDMVSRVKKKFSKEIKAKQDEISDSGNDDSSDCYNGTYDDCCVDSDSDNCVDNNSDCDNDCYTVTDYDTDNYTDTDTMRQDSATVDIFPEAKDNSVLENNNGVKGCEVMTVSKPKTKEQIKEEYTHRGITKLIRNKGTNTGLSDEDLEKMKQDLLAMLENEFGFLEKYSDLIGRLGNYYKLSDQVWCLQQMLIKERKERYDRIEYFKRHEQSIQQKSKYVNQFGFDAHSSLPRIVEECAVERIIEKYLSSHQESRYLKSLGDRYGRLITGWNEKLQEPCIVYSMIPFPVDSKHKIDDIPKSYYIDKEIVSSNNDDKKAESNSVDDGEIETEDLPF